jgi:uncharacterized protein (TIGR00369 family)
MPAYAAQDPQFETSVRRSFDRLTLMRTLGARLRTVVPGEVEIDLPFRDELTQHHGYLAGAALTAIADVACGYAAMTLMPPGASVLTIEYKVNFLAPAQGERMLARARVVRPGRTITVCSGDVVAIAGETEKVVATMLATMATVSPREEELPPHVVAAHPRRRWCVCRRFRMVVTAGGARRLVRL